jgi:hypothetical protein
MTRLLPGAIIPGHRLKGILMSFKLKSLKTRLIDFRWNELPYGICTTNDAREILFNRYYQPIWERLTGGWPFPADRSKWVTGIVKQDYFYDDGTPNKEKAGVEALERWGIAHEIWMPAQIRCYCKAA